MHRALVLAASLLAVLAVAGTAWAAFPGGNGRIAFAKSTGTAGDYDIVSVRPDGTGQRTITGSPLADFDPSYSADGKKVAFVRDVKPGLAVNFEIFVKNLVTGKVRRITKNPDVDQEPAFAPGGKRVAFVSNRDGGYDIWIVTLSSGALQRIERTGADLGPTWSPDGGTIAFWGQNGPSTDIFFVKPGGSGFPVPFTETAGYDEAYPNFSPDGSEVVYQRSSVAGSRARIVVESAAGGSRRALTSSTTDNLTPAFSPNGRSIVWARNREPGIDTTGRLWRMRADGTRKVRLTGTDAKQPDWQPRP